MAALAARAIVARRAALVNLLGLLGLSICGRPMVHLFTIECDPLLSDTDLSQVGAYRFIENRPAHAQVRGSFAHPDIADRNIHAVGGLHA